ncbi:unnamed protein product [Phyllotreta striolata]|uniref:Uncharacterized protein n=1 Tax=Phyllotreta striolata TaxID=444603 RepID=A0A9N9XVJ5_PHYSR|nr:unnamed protein product [Phyllotreta striolata]
MHSSILKTLVLVLNFCALAKCTSTDSTSTEPTTTSTPILYVSENNVTWNPRNKEKIDIECDEGYQLSATITNCSINCYNNEYAQITSDPINLNLTITCNITNSPSFFFNTNKINVNYTGTENSTLTIVFSRVGEPPTTTTTEITSSTIYLPTASLDDHPDLTVQISGRDPYDYRRANVLGDFKEMIALMAKEYCETNNFTLIHNVTKDNVEIKEILPCSWKNPSCDSCAEVRFAVPVEINPNSSFEWAGYQLTEDHLRLMWDRYSSKYLNESVTTCPPDDVRSKVIWEIALIAAFTLAFVVLFFSVHYRIDRLARKIRIKSRRLVQTSDSNDSQSNDVSLRPHYLQDIPPLFDSNYSMHDPGSGYSNVAYETNEPYERYNNEDEELSDGSISA